MISHLDHNGSWVLLVYAIAFAALIVATYVTLERTKKRKRLAEKLEGSED